MESIIRLKVKQSMALMQLDIGGALVDQLRVVIGGNREHRNHPASLMNKSVYLEVLHEQLCARL